MVAVVARREHLDFMEITHPPGSSSTTDDRMLRHDGFEHGYLLEGELQVTLGFDEFTLRAGQAMGLNSSIPPVREPRLHVGARDLVRAPPARLTPAARSVIVVSTG